MTNAQIALLAAAIVDAGKASHSRPVLADAENYFAWLTAKELT